MSTGKKTSNNKKRTRKKKAVGKNIKEFRSNHDKNYIIPKRIDQALTDLGEAWLYEAEFLRQAGVANTDIPQFRDQYEDHIVYVDRTKRIWCGTKEFADELRELAS